MPEDGLKGNPDGLVWVDGETEPNSPGKKTMVHARERIPSSRPKPLTKCSPKWSGMPAQDIWVVGGSCLQVLRIFTLL